MGTGRKYRKISHVRPTKTGAVKRRREKVQRRRLVALGVPEEKVRRMTIADVRAMLRRPAKIAKLTSGAGAATPQAAGTP